MVLDRLKIEIPAIIDEYTTIEDFRLGLDPLDYACVRRQVIGKGAKKSLLTMCLAGHNNRIKGIRVSAYNRQTREECGLWFAIDHDFWEFDEEMIKSMPKKKQF